ncbi:MAG: hypothetical protein WDZ28_02150 [Simkaniaceae bacterium]
MNNINQRIEFPGCNYFFYNKKYITNNENYSVTKSVFIGNPYLKTICYENRNKKITITFRKMGCEEVKKAYLSLTDRLTYDCSHDDSSTCRLSNLAPLSQDLYKLLMTSIFSKVITCPGPPCVLERKKLGNKTTFINTSNKEPKIVKQIDLEEGKIKIIYNSVSCEKFRRNYSSSNIHFQFSHEHNLGICEMSSKANKLLSKCLYASLCAKKTS